MKKEKKLRHFLVFCHRSSILNQWIESSKRIGLNVESWDPEENNIKSFHDLDGLAVTYQSASKKLNQLLFELEGWNSEEVLTIADEAHHLGLNPEEAEGPIWGKVFLSLTLNQCLDATVRQLF